MLCFTSVFFAALNNHIWIISATDDKDGSNIDYSSLRLDSQVFFCEKKISENKIHVEERYSAKGKRGKEKCFVYFGTLFYQFNLTKVKYI